MEKLNRVGEVKINNDGEESVIVNYRGATDLDVLFLDGTIHTTCYSNFKRGCFRNKNTPRIYGVGYVGYGNYDTFNYKKYTDVWIRMLQRCYQKNQLTYKEVTVCAEWHNFQNFAKWMDEIYNINTMQRWHLDKDIICKSCKIYSPETCVFVPQEINNLFTSRHSCRGDYPIGVLKRKDKRTKIFESSFTKNSKTYHIGYYDTPEEAFQAYKIAKEQHIKEVAEKWKDQIDPRVYESLLEYQVKITD